MFNSKMANAYSLRQSSIIFLVGNSSENIIGSKLPSKKQVLQNLFYFLREKKLSLKVSCIQVIQNVVVFWEKARIPTKKSFHSEKKLEDLYEIWRALQKSSKKRSLTQQNKEKEFVDSLDDLFDIAHEDALNLIKIPADRDFLENQRKKGRVGSMAGIDLKLTQREKRSAERLQKENERKKKCDEKIVDKNFLSGEMSDMNSKIVVECFKDSDDEFAEPSTSNLKKGVESSEDREDEFTQPSTSREDEFTQPSTSISKASTEPSTSSASSKIKTNILDPELVGALDRFSVTDHAASFIIKAVIKNLGLEVDNYSVSRQSIRRLRRNIRAAESEKFHDSFNPPPSLVVHWDSKLLPNETKTEKIDWLPVIACGVEFNQLLEVCSLQSGTGEEMASAVFQTLIRWDCDQKIKGMCFDTTASNTGCRNGACKLLEQKLDRELSYFACRHHIFELVLRCVFEECLKIPTSGPDVQIFKRFKTAWPEIDASDYEIYSSNLDVANCVNPIKDHVLAFSLLKLKEDHPREDYREFLELVVIFLGETPIRGVTFRRPGAIHHARWMAKAIYSLKIFLFRKQFNLNAQEDRGIVEICKFVVIVYIEAWFNARDVTGAPKNDLKFLKDLINYEAINSSISKIARGKFCGHLWYLTEEMVALALFDDEENTTLLEKTAIVKSINEVESECEEKRLSLRLNSKKECEALLEKGIHEFASKSSKKFLERFKINGSFLAEPPSKWCNNNDFLTGKIIVKSIEVCNDRAERGISLIEKYANFSTKDPVQKQYLLKSVEKHRSLHKY